MPSQFLFNESLWSELGKRVPKAKKVRAAVAYFGTGGASLLPLRKGDELVVDMSVARVRTGATNPNEIKKLLKCGVTVFSRASLHAKFFIIDDVVIAGSSNVSSNARSKLDEAAVLTGDVAAVQRARSTFDRLCTEPVRKDYLELCIKEYRPPKFVALPGAKGSKPKVQPAKLWLIANLTYGGVPAREEPSADEIVEKASKKLKDFEKTEVQYTHYPTKEPSFPRYARATGSSESFATVTATMFGPQKCSWASRATVEARGSSAIYCCSRAQPTGNQCGGARFANWLPFNSGRNLGGSRSVMRKLLMRCCVSGIAAAV